jgi:phosphoribosylformylglycinamidine synthase
MSAPSQATPYRLEIGLRPGLRDARGEGVAETVRDFLHIGVQRVRTRDVYHLAADITPEEAQRVLDELCDGIVQTGALDRLAGDEFDFAVAVGFKPGVTDPVGKSAKVAVEDTLGRKLADDAQVFTSTLYLLSGVDRSEAERIAVELLANPIIQTTRIQSFAEWQQAPPDVSVPRVTSHARPAVESVDLGGSDDALLELSRKRLLSLNLVEMRAIRDHFLNAGTSDERTRLGLSASPTDVELECLAQTWSEHCKHKIFNATVTLEDGDGPPETIRSLFATYIRGATKAIDAKDFLVSVFHDNAGVVTFDEQHHLVYKVETHNSPSALDPYGGAITGIVGVNRDPFGTGLGADLLTNVWGYCFASPFHSGPLPKGLLHPRRIRAGVHHGVIDGGNQSGIPYGRGWELFDARFLGKPLVFCGTVGALPVTIAGRPGHEKGARPGDLIVMVGGRIGADGIHGATFSSAALDESAPIQAVQIGDPITQKRMFDFLLEARDQGLYTAITDNGAGGLSSSVGEMSEKSGGARLDLERAPLKYAGLAPWEILLSEAQERMTLAVAPNQLEQLLALAKRREVEASVLGEFTDSGYFHVQYGTRTVAHIAMSFLHAAPDLNLSARWQPKPYAEPNDPAPSDLSRVLTDLVARLNVCSNESMARHYDHEVKGLTVVKPFVGVKANVPPEATVFLLRHGSLRGYVLSEGVNPFYSDIDTHAMARAVVDIAVRRQLAAGARLDRIALLDNFCWPDPEPSPENPDALHKMAGLVRACRGLYEAAVQYRAPLISGKDSMKNDSRMGGVRISVPPTLLLSAIGQIDDVRNAITLDPKAPGEVVYLVGETRDETGASEYFRLRGERASVSAGVGEPAPFVGRKVPRIDLASAWAAYQSVEAAAREGLIRAVGVPALGGLGVTLARMAMAAELGFELDLSLASDLAGLPPDVALFSESLARLVISVAPENAARFEGLVKCVRIGSVTRDPRMRAKHAGTTVLDVDLADLVRGFESTLGGGA